MVESGPLARRARFLSGRSVRFLASDGVLIGAAFLLALACYTMGERVEVSNGFGWDGILYGNWARDFHDEIFVKRVNAYYIQRILPAAIVHYSMRFLGVPRSDAAILQAFGMYAVALLTLAAWAWCSIARSLQLSPAGKWLGFTGLFLNYIALRYVSYIPAGTDATAYTMGILMFACYLCGRRIGLALVTLLGAFAWPTVVYIGALLLIFPRSDAPPGPLRPVPRALPLLATALLTVLAAGGFGIALRTPPTVETVFIEPRYIEPYLPALPLSLAISLAYLCLGAFPLLESNRLYDLRAIFTRRRLFTALLVAIAILAVKTVQSRLSRHEPFWEVGILLAQTAYASVTWPGVFLVTHAAFYGPMFVLAMLLWKRTCHYLNEAGPGVTLAVFFGLLLSLNSQSRYVINIFPILLPFVVKATDDLRWRATPYALIAVLAVLMSKIWFTINTGPFTGRLREFPDQGFFMTHGPWISPTMYAVQGGLLLAIGIVLYRVCFPHSRRGRSGEFAATRFADADSRPHGIPR